MYFNDTSRNIADRRGDKPSVSSRHALFFLSPAWFATSCAVAVFSGVKKDRPNMVKAIATAIVYFILAVISCRMLYDGMSI